MKIWYGYGSEHSANLVMLARFKDIAGAEAAKRALDRLREQCSEKLPAEEFYNDLRDSYPDHIRKLLTELNIGSIGPAELEQFLYDHTVSINGATVKIETDELEISSFFKVFLSLDAKIEVYSAHSHGSEEPGQEKP